MANSKEMTLTSVKVKADLFEKQIVHYTYI